LTHSSLLTQLSNSFPLKASRRGKTYGVNCSVIVDSKQLAKNQFEALQDLECHPSTGIKLERHRILDEATLHYRRANGLPQLSRILELVLASALLVAACGLILRRYRRNARVA
jgi:hypothetical protein